MAEIVQKKLYSFYYYFNIIISISHHAEVFKIVLIEGRKLNWHSEDSWSVGKGSDVWNNDLRQMFMLAPLFSSCAARENARQVHRETQRIQTAGPETCKC